VTAEAGIERRGHPRQIGLRVAPGSAAAARVEALLGAPLPGPCLAANGILWLGPDEWLCVECGASEAALLEALDGEGAAVELSANRLALAVSGPAARDLLAGCCSVDLHPRAFPPGTCVQTLVAGVPVILELMAEPAQFRLMVRPSFADHVEAWLRDGAAAV
jgi:sarcosine oxidase subunit gamma